MLYVRVDIPRAPPFSFGEHEKHLFPGHNCSDMIQQKDQNIELRRTKIDLSVLYFLSIVKEVPKQRDLSESSSPLTNRRSTSRNSLRVNLNPACAVIYSLYFL